MNRIANALVICLVLACLQPRLLWAAADDPALASLDGKALADLRVLEPGAEARVLLHWHSGEAMRSGDAPLPLEIRLRRIEVYAADAKVLEATADGYRELPRDTRMHFVAEASAGQRVGLSFDPETGSAEGVLLHSGRMYALSGNADAQGLALQAHDMNAPLADGSVADATCSGDMGSVVDALNKSRPGGAQTLQPKDALLARGTAGSFAPKVATRQLTLAIDTDNELLLSKFSNNTTTATSYVAALVTALNAIYEDDPAQYGLQLRLVQGTVILRPSTTPDPYSNTDSSATGAALNEFGSWWSSNQSGVSRAFALMLSGKSANQNSSSGIAWLLTGGTYCSATGASGGHYSVNQVFRNPGFSAAQDAYLVGHELGHNLGARHTHCASASNGAQASTGTIDRCFSGESGAGCYAGTQACPSGGESPLAPQGTLMSYCHLNGLGCGVSTELHPTHVTQLNARLASQPSSCLAPIGGNSAPTVNAPASFAATEDVALALTGISYADADSASLTATFSLAAGNGSLNASSGGGVTVGGSASARTLVGSPAALNSFISASSLSYSPAANASGAVTLTLQISDGGSPVSRNATINIAAVNDAPTLSLPASITLSEDVAGPVRPLSFADVDAGSANVLATFSVPAGALSAVSGGGVSVGGSATARTLSGSIANLNSYIAAGSLSYLGAANANGAITLTVTLNDQGNTPGPAQQAQGTLSLQLAAVNDPPTVSAPTSRQVQAGQSVAISGVSYADPDAPGGAVAVVATYSTGTGSFTAVSAGGITVGGSGSATLSLSGSLSALNNFVASTPVLYLAPQSASGTVPLSLSINDQGNIGGGALTGNAVVNAIVMSEQTLFVDGFE